MWESRLSRPRQGLAEETKTGDEVAKGWRSRQPFVVRSDGDELHSAIGPIQMEPQGGGIRRVLALDF
jgi:hypothetical protein